MEIISEGKSKQIKKGLAILGLFSVSACATGCGDLVKVHMEKTSSTITEDIPLPDPNSPLSIVLACQESGNYWGFRVPHHIKLDVSVNRIPTLADALMISIKDNEKVVIGGAWGRSPNTAEVSGTNTFFGLVLGVDDDIWLQSGHDYQVIISEGSNLIPGEVVAATHFRKICPDVPSDPGDSIPRAHKN